MEGHLGNLAQARTLLQAGLQVDPCNEMCWVALIRMEEQRELYERADLLRRAQQRALRHHQLPPSFSTLPGSDKGSVMQTVRCPELRAGDSRLGRLHQQSRGGKEQGTVSVDVRSAGVQVFNWMTRTSGPGPLALSRSELDSVINRTSAVQTASRVVAEIEAEGTADGRAWPRPSRAADSTESSAILRATEASEDAWASPPAGDDSPGGPAASLEADPDFSDHEAAWFSGDEPAAVDEPAAAVVRDSPAGDGEGSSHERQLPFASPAAAPAASTPDDVLLRRNGNGSPPVETVAPTTGALTDDVSAALPPTVSAAAARVPETPSSQDDGDVPPAASATQAAAAVKAAASAAATRAAADVPATAAEPVRREPAVADNGAAEDSAAAPSPEAATQPSQQRTRVPPEDAAEEWVKPQWPKPAPGRVGQPVPDEAEEFEGWAAVSRAVAASVMPPAPPPPAGGEPLKPVPTSLPNAKPVEDSQLSFRARGAVRSARQGVSWRPRETRETSGRRRKGKSRRAAEAGKERPRSPADAQESDPGDG